jgi:hypothetical protein
MGEKESAEYQANYWIECWNNGTPDLIPLAEDFSHTNPFGHVEGRDRAA